MGNRQNPLNSLCFEAHEDSKSEQKAVPKRSKTTRRNDTLALRPPLGIPRRGGRKDEFAGVVVVVLARRQQKPKCNYFAVFANPKPKPECNH